MRETSSRDRYRKLKRDITAKLTYERFVLPAAGVASYRAALTKAALLPLTAVALPTIRESSDAGRRKLSDPQHAPPRPIRSPVPASRAVGRSVCPMSSLRPCLSALPIRSWNSDDSEFLATCGPGSEATCQSGGGGTAKRARLCRIERVDESVVAPSNIPIIISSPDDCDKQLDCAGNKPASDLLSAAPRRSSCPFPVYDVTTADCEDEMTARDVSTSRKRRHDFAQSVVSSHRRPSLQSVAGGRAEQKRVGSVRRTTGRRGRADATSQSASLDVQCISTRRLSLPLSSTSLTDERPTVDRLQLPALL